MTKQEFLRLVDTYLDGKASFQEEQQLLDFYNQFDISDNWNEEVLGGKALLEEKMLNRLMLSLNEQQPVHKLVFPLWTKIAAVASFILICTTAVFLYQHSQTDDHVLHTKADSRDFILPGKNQASLTLANGEKVLLNDSNIGTLNNLMGNSVLVNDGQLIYNTQSKGEVGKYNLIEIPRGGQYQVILPDGSKVWLNSESSLQYPVAFPENERKVVLTGEAYFEVVKNHKKPFKVEILHQNIEVLGTQFNVSAYTNQANLKTTLIEGSVKVSVATDKPLMLKPGEQAQTDIIPNNQSRIISKKVDVDEIVAWKNGDFIFANSNITDVMKQIERWYDVEIVYEGKVTTDKFYGIISRSKKLGDVLNLLETAGTVQFNVTGNTIEVRN